jgi:hypothetical protein
MTADERRDAVVAAGIEDRTGILVSALHVHGPS